ncbi:MAG TPA: hypothetical protein VF181_09590 [Balneolaceae bacterium]
MSNQLSRKEYIYLDWNVIQRFKNGDFTIRLKELKRRFDKKNLQFFFTDAHLMEASAITLTDTNRKNKILNQDLNSLSILSNNLYLERVKNSDETKFFNAHPAEVYKQKGEYFKIFRNAFIGALENINFEKIWGDTVHPQLSANYLNNFDEEEIIEKINELLKTDEISQVFKQYGTKATSFDDLVSKVHSHLNQENNNSLNLLSDYFSTAFTLLDGLGFKSEKRRNEKFYSSIFDIRHAFNATRTKYFITDDEKLRLKAKVLYQWFGFDTVIMDIREMSKLIAIKVKVEEV